MAPCALEGADEDASCALNDASGPQRAGSRRLHSQDSLLYDTLKLHSGLLALRKRQSHVDRVGALALIAALQQQPQQQLPGHLLQMDALFCASPTSPSPSSCPSSSVDPASSSTSSALSSSSLCSAGTAACLQQLHSQAHKDLCVIVQQPHPCEPFSREARAGPAAAAAARNTEDAPGDSTESSSLCTISQLGSLLPSASSLKTLLPMLLCGASNGSSSNRPKEHNSSSSSKARDKRLGNSSSSSNLSSAGSTADDALAASSSDFICPNCGSSRCIIDVARLIRLSPAAAAAAAATATAVVATSLGSGSSSAKAPEATASSHVRSTATTTTTTSSSSSGPERCSMGMLACLRGPGDGGCKPRPTKALQLPLSCAVAAGDAPVCVAAAPPRLIRQHSGMRRQQQLEQRQQQQQQQQQEQQQQPPLHKRLIRWKSAPNLLRLDLHSSS